MNDLESRIIALEERNKKVDLNKKWEGSFIRKLCIAGITYLVVSVYFFLIQASNPFLNAIVPTC